MAGAPMREGWGKAAAGMPHPAYPAAPASPHPYGEQAGGAAYAPMPYGGGGGYYTHEYPGGGGGGYTSGGYTHDYSDAHGGYAHPREGWGAAHVRDGGYVSAGSAGGAHVGSDSGDAAEAAPRKKRTRRGRDRTRAADRAAAAPLDPSDREERAGALAGVSAALLAAAYVVCEEMRLRRRHKKKKRLDHKKATGGDGGKHDDPPAPAPARTRTVSRGSRRAASPPPQRWGELVLDSDAEQVVNIYQYSSAFLASAAGGAGTGAGPRFDIPLDEWVFRGMSDSDSGGSSASDDDSHAVGVGDVPTVPTPASPGAPAPAGAPAGTPAAAPSSEGQPQAPRGMGGEPAEGPRDASNDNEKNDKRAKKVRISSALAIREEAIRRKTYLETLRRTLLKGKMPGDDGEPAASGGRRANRRERDGDRAVHFESDGDGGGASDVSGSSSAGSDSSGSTSETVEEWPGLGVAMDATARLSRTGDIGGRSAASHLIRIYKRRHPEPPATRVAEGSAISRRSQWRAGGGALVSKIRKQEGFPEPTADPGGPAAAQKATGRDGAKDRKKKGEDTASGTPALAAPKRSASAPSGKRRGEPPTHEELAKAGWVTIAAKGAGAGTAKKVAEKKEEAAEEGKKVDKKKGPPAVVMVGGAATHQRAAVLMAKLQQAQNVEAQRKMQENMRIQREKSGKPRATEEISLMDFVFAKPGGKKKVGGLVDPETVPDAPATTPAAPTVQRVVAPATNGVDDTAFPALSTAAAITNAAVRSKSQERRQKAASTGKDKPSGVSVPISKTGAPAPPAPKRSASAGPAAAATRSRSAPVAERKPLPGRTDASAAGTATSAKGKADAKGGAKPADGGLKIIPAKAARDEGDAATGSGPRAVATRGGFVVERGGKAVVLKMLARGKQKEIHSQLAKGVVAAGPSTSTAPAAAGDGAGGDETAEGARAARKKKKKVSKVRKVLLREINREKAALMRVILEADGLLRVPKRYCVVGSGGVNEGLLRPVDIRSIDVVAEYEAAERERRLQEQQQQQQQQGDTEGCPPAPDAADPTDAAAACATHSEGGATAEAKKKARKKRKKKKSKVVEAEDAAAVEGDGDGNGNGGPEGEPRVIGDDSGAEVEGGGEGTAAPNAAASAAAASASTRNPKAAMEKELQNYLLPVNPIGHLMDERKDHPQSRIRSYVDQMLTRDLDDMVVDMMHKLKHFQHRLRVEQPLKFKAKMRYVIGLKECLKGAATRRLKAAIVVPDIQVSRDEGGLDDIIGRILITCRANDVPVVFAHSKKSLGVRCFGHPLRTVSCLGIFSADGANQEFAKILRTADALRTRYQDVLAANQALVAGTSAGVSFHKTAKELQEQRDRERALAQMTEDDQRRKAREEKHQQVLVAAAEREARLAEKKERQERRKKRKDEAV